MTGSVRATSKEQMTFSSNDETTSECNMAISSAAVTYILRLYDADIGIEKAVEVMKNLKKG